MQVKSLSTAVMRSIILNTDSYKPSHYLQYPDGTEYVFSYVESRGGQYDEVVANVGLQYELLEYLAGQVVTQEQIDFADEFFKLHGEPFNREGWQYILEVHDGFLPLEIRAVPEGMVVPVKNILSSVINTDPNCGWLTSYVETLWLRASWYATTVATRSRNIKKIIKSFLETTGDVGGLPFKLHDFGARGVSSYESAGLGGMGHLVNFMGSDTITGVLFARQYYGENMAGVSIPAAEHSTTSILGRDGEYRQFARMIEKFGKKGALFAVVSDTYDLAAAVETWGTTFKDVLLKSESMLVVRPDSGDPVRMSLETIRGLEKNFGCTVNEKGFKVLNGVRVIYGDGINDLSVESILRTLEVNRYSADNIAFGMGGQLLQGLDRDTQKYAMKASAACINGVWRDVFKDPVTDPGKTSKKGRMSLFKNRETGEFATLRIDQGDIDPVWEDVMVTVFRNGEILKYYTFEEVRANAAL